MGAFEEILLSKVRPLIEEDLRRLEIAKTHHRTSSDWIGAFSEPASPRAGRPVRRSPYASTPNTEKRIERSLLNEALKEAVVVMETLGARIPAVFNEKLLRAEWRRLACQWHPDRNPGRDGTCFTQLRAAYLSLRAEF